jgi:hypothetical protein
MLLRFGAAFAHDGHALLKLEDWIMHRLHPWSIFIDLDTIDVKPITVQQEQAFSASANVAPCMGKSVSHPRDHSN